MTQARGAMKASPIHKLALSLIACTSLLRAAEPVKDTQLSADESLVQLAILLDTSNSMDGLIAQATGGVRSGAVEATLRTVARGDTLHLLSDRLHIAVGEALA